MGSLKKKTEEIKKEAIIENKENIQDVNECLDLLVSLAETKAETNLNKIMQELTDGKVLDTTLHMPITHVVDRQIQYRCITETSSSDFLQDIADSVKAIVSDHSPIGVINGVTKIIYAAMQPLFGSITGTDQYACATTAYVDGALASLVRLDVMVWSRSVKSSSLMKSIQQVFSSVAVKSVIDVTKIPFETFRQIYSATIDPTNITDLAKEIENAKSLYTALDGGSKLKKEPVLWSTRKVNQLDISDLIKTTSAQSSIQD